MKLSYKRTVLVGFAFFLIMAFWQAYDATIPVILTNKFGMSQTWSGVIMALDNILALFMLPLFGAISDRCKSKYGRRKPFVVIGTVVAVTALLGLSIVDVVQIKNISAVSTIDDPAALATIYRSQKDATLQTPDGTKFILSEEYTEEAFCEIPSQIPAGNKQMKTNPEYTDFVVPARQAYISDLTANNSTTLKAFVILLLVVLIAMSVFRSPAVALMPDVTLKPLRSKANAVINLMGTAGGIIILVAGKLFATSALKNAMMSYLAYYAVVIGVMLVALAIFTFFVREKEWAAQMEADTVKFAITEDDTNRNGKKRRLSMSEMGSLLLILASVALWYFGYNAVTSKYAVYAGTILYMDYNMTLLLAQGAAIVAYLPAGMIASKIGRKKTILAGVVMLSSAFGLAAFMNSDSPVWLMNTLFVLAGIGWATINVNSFPMVVEMSSGGDVGKYTGFYYTASMAAQIITPVFSGYLMDKMGMLILFPYAAVFSGLAFLTMFFVKHGDTKPAAVKGLEALDVDD